MILIREGKVRLNGAICLDPEKPCRLGQEGIQVDGGFVGSALRIYLMLNKPRGLVTTRSDEQGRDTVYRCFEGASLPWISPVGRLDRASEGLILFSNDSAWAARILLPQSHLDKVYHVQVNGIPTLADLQRMQRAADVSSSDNLCAKEVSLLRRGTRNSWLRIVLDEGKNRQIRRLLEAQELEVLRLVRVSIGPLELGDLPKGKFRHLTPAEIQALAGT